MLLEEIPGIFDFGWSWWIWWGLMPVLAASLGISQAAAAFMIFGRVEGERE